jgi:hypothetical protein
MVAVSEGQDCTECGDGGLQDRSQGPWFKWGLRVS